MSDASRQSARSLLWVNHFAVLPGAGGGTRHFELSRELVRKGWQVTVAASDFNLHSRAYARRAGSRDRQRIPERVEGVDFCWVWAWPYQGNDWRRVANWVTFAAGAGRAVERAPDVVIGSSPHLLAAMAAYRRARRWGVPFVLEVRDLWPESLDAVGQRKGATYRAFDRMARFLYARADAIIVLARGTGEYLVRERGVAPERIHYVPNGVDPEAFPARPTPVERDRFTLVYAGAHGTANGLDVVLGAAERLRDEPRFRFLLVGDGPAKAALVAEASARGLSNVEFRAPVPKSEIPRLLAEADAGLMVLRDAPLFSFGVSPNKLFDYMGAQLPVVCNVPGEVADMVRGSGAGVQAEDTGPAALASAVRALGDHTLEQRAAMGAAGLAWVSREHGRKPVAERLEAALLAVTDPSVRGPQGRSR